MDPIDVSPAPRTLHRRAALGLLAGAGAAVLVGCSSDEPVTSAASSSTTQAATGATATTAGGTATTGADTDTCTTIPEETAGPFPGDGTNGPDYLTMDGAVRQDIRSSLGSDEPVPGVAVDLRLTIVEAAAGCAPLAGAAVYAWHCDAIGQYSMYADGVEDETFCRGIQVTDDRGELSFTTVFPGCYPGRWPHIHFEVYRSVEDATGGGRPIATSQLAFSAEDSEAVFATAAYGDSARNLSSLSLESDMIFADGYDDQLAATSGNPTDGYTASLTVAV